MEEPEHDNDYVLAFDHFYTNNHIQILKSLLPYINSGKQSMLPVLIKYMELRHTILLIKEGQQPMPPNLSACSKDAPDLEEIYKAIRKYLAPNEDKSFQQIINMMHTMSNVREMQQMMEFMQSMSGDASDAGNGFPDLSGLENMMGNGMNMSDMMQLFKDMK